MPHFDDDLASARAGMSGDGGEWYPRLWWRNYECLFISISFDLFVISEGSVVYARKVDIEVFIFKTISGVVWDKSTKLIFSILHAVGVLFP